MININAKDSDVSWPRHTLAILREALPDEVTCAQVTAELKVLRTRRESVKQPNWYVQYQVEPDVG